MHDTTAPTYSDGRTYTYLGKLPRGEAAAPAETCRAVALGAVGDCTLAAGHAGPHQNVATADAFEIGPPNAHEPCPRCHAPAGVACLGWCPVGWSDERRAAEIHVHVEHESRDCDGSYSRDEIRRPADGEDEHAFLERVVGSLVSVYSVAGQLTVSEHDQHAFDGTPVSSGTYTDVPARRVYDWHESTEEGYAAASAETCYRHGCDR